jgi:NAD(P)-dependent dehydrogenase (short-subunit alcohol dehydrogenase family)
MDRDGRLAGKRALVTGSGTGIGREIALEFAREGADVVLHYAHSDAGAKSAAEEIAAMGRKTTALRADLSVVSDVKALGDGAIDFLGGLDCLVNNAGISFNKPFLKVEIEQFEMMYDVNIRAQFVLTQRVIRDMLEHGGGSICNLTSVHGLAGMTEHTVYAGTKGAIIAYTRALAVEFAHRGIRANAIAPGAVLVENHRKVIPGLTDEAVQQSGHDLIPGGRWGVPVDIAKLAVFLCSSDSEYIIGQTIVADGGSLALMSLCRDFRTESAATFGAGYLPGV